MFLPDWTREVRTALSARGCDGWHLHSSRAKDNLEGCWCQHTSPATTTIKRWENKLTGGKSSTQQLESTWGIPAHLLTCTFSSPYLYYVTLHGDRTETVQRVQRFIFYFFFLTTWLLQLGRGAATAAGGAKKELLWKKKAREVNSGNTNLMCFSTSGFALTGCRS